MTSDTANKIPRHEAKTTIRLDRRNTAPMFFHEEIGTIGPEGGEQVKMLRSFGAGMVWQVRGENFIATFDVKALLEAAAELVIDADKSASQAAE